MRSTRPAEAQQARHPLNSTTQPASRLRGFACKKRNERRPHAKTRRRESIARNVQTSCDPLGQPRPSRQGNPSIAPPNLLRGFAPSRAKKHTERLTHAKTRRNRTEGANIMRSTRPATAQLATQLPQQHHNSLLRGFAASRAKKHNERLTHAKTRRREGIARKAQTSCDPLCRPGQSRQRSCRNCTSPACFAASRLRVQKKHTQYSPAAMTRRLNPG